MKQSALIVTPQETEELHSKKNVAGEYFFFGKDENADQLFQIIAGGVQYDDSKDRIEISDQSYYTLEFIVSGSAQIKKESESFRLCAGNIVLHHPEETFTISNDGTGKLVKYFVNFKVKNEMAPIWKNFTVKEGPMFIAKNRWIKQTFEQLIQGGSSRNEFAEDLCTTLMKYLISRINSDQQNFKPTINLAKESFERTKTYIEENYKTITNMKQVSQACNLTPPHISRLFKQFGKQSPSDLLIELKMQKAVELLSEGKYLIKEIASMIGFEDQYYFSTRFKQVFGSSPKKFIELRQVS